jgi:Transmembrane family, TMEM144 of transporters
LTYIIYPKSGIYGIRYAGLAVAVGTWSSIIVITSFLFGIIVFQESVRSFMGALCAFTLLMIGLIGMSRYSAKPSSSSSSLTNEQTSRIGFKNVLELVPTPNSDHHPNEISTTLTTTTQTKARKTVQPPTSTFNVQDAVATTTDALHGMDSYDMHDDENDNNSSSTIPLLKSLGSATKLDDVDHHHLILDDDDNNNYPNKPNVVVLFGGRISLTRRQIGILGAIFNGSWGGLNLIPLHYARAQNENLTGAGYIISYACGSMIVQISLWLLLYLYYYLWKTMNHHTTTVDHSSSSYHERMMDAFEMLPKFRSDLIIPGLLCGLLYSIGNFGSIIAVSYLGQGTGFSVCQMTLFVSGLWGIFYFHEIEDKQYIIKWFISAFIAVLGIIWLSYEHGSGGH